MGKREVKISLLLESLKTLEKAYRELRLNSSKDLKEPAVKDKLRSLINLSFESFMRICRHLSVVFSIKNRGKDCLIRLSEFLNYSDLEGVKRISQYYYEYRDLSKEVDEESLREVVNTSLKVFKELAREVVEFVKRETKNPYLIDFQLLREKERHIAESLKRINFIISRGFEEFSKEPMYYDRVKYFYMVAYDSLLDICLHLAPKFGIKGVSEDCPLKLIEGGILPQSLREDLKSLYLLKVKLLNDWDVPKEELYERLRSVEETFKKTLKALALYLKSFLRS